MELTQFIELNPLLVLYLIFVGFVGGLVSGFIGSGGAFVLTPAMMSLGVPGLVAVASNMCHKFPKALVGAIKRHGYGQVDIKLGIVIGIFAEAGILYGATLQRRIQESFGDVGSNLYVSLVFVGVLAVVGTIVLYDALKTRRSANRNKEEKTSGIAKRVQSVNIPGTMMYFSSIGTKVSLLFIIPLGFATGMLAATIAVGGFVGVPGMIYLLGAPSLMASATELVIAFIMGMGGTLKYALHGMVDIRLAMLILLGSLFGVQLGAIGTTYVRPYLIKLVMGVIMIIVLFSRALMVPIYLGQLNLMEPFSGATNAVLRTASCGIMFFALCLGAFIVLAAIWMGRREEQQTANI